MPRIWIVPFKRCPEALVAFGRLSKEEDELTKAKARKVALLAELATIDARITRAEAAVRVTLNVLEVRT